MANEISCHSALSIGIVNMIKRGLYVVVTIFFVGFATFAQKPTYHIRGEIISNEDGRYLVAGNNAPDVKYNKVLLTITQQTKIVRCEGEDFKAANKSDLKKGVRVEITMDETVKESDPPQSDAVRIVILPSVQK